VLTEGLALPTLRSASERPARTGQHEFVVVANRLPVDRTEGPDGIVRWRRSPGGLVSALEPVMQGADGAWIGWSGSPGEAPDPFVTDGMHLVGVALSEQEVTDYYEGFANSTLWPLYHDVIAAPQFHRHWWEAYVEVNARFADVSAVQAAPGATVWVQDYQLQLVPAMLRERRPDLRIGFFNHIPFPGYEIFAQLPWRRQIIEGLLGADLVGFQRRGDAANFLRACRRTGNVSTKGSVVRVPVLGGVPDRADLVRPGRPGSPRAVRPVSITAGQVGPAGMSRDVRAAAFPISIDAARFGALARRPDIQARSREIRAALGNPKVVLLGIDRLDYTKGIPHRLNAYGELLDDGKLGPPEAVLVQVASPSRERVGHYQALRDEVEGVVGRINGDHASLGHPAVHYLHQSYPPEEMAALYLAADVMLVTPLRDGMNLVSKEYVACRSDETGALVLSEFTGAADELTTAFLVNPHDIEGMKQAIVQAMSVEPGDAARRMRAMRKRVFEYDVNRWASTFLEALAAAPGLDSGRNWITSISTVPEPA
jgi:alpha,alpha-trehalose-phosphate synthase [UDP-forming]